MTKTTAGSERACGGKDPTSRGCLAFEGQRCLARGDLAKVARKAKQAADNPEHGPILIFDAISSHPIEIDLRGSVEEVLERLARVPSSGTPDPPAAERRGPGRPKLGVIGREVTLLPRHWDWLDGQPGGPSVALRKLVEEARRSNRGKDLARQSQDAVYRFMSAMAGDLPGFEEALRAFYRGNKAGVDELIRAWPADIRRHVERLMAAAYADEAQAGKR
jgi:uncharacterized protein